MQQLVNCRWIVDILEALEIGNGSEKGVTVVIYFFNSNEWLEIMPVQW